MQKAVLEYLTEYPLENVTITKIIKDALSYRIAKEPILKRHELFGLSMHCPTCDRMDIAHFQYCPDCGQSIAWWKEDN
mgnify:CR=1 FL=1